MIQYLIETFLIAFGSGLFACMYYKVLRSKAPARVQKFMADNEKKWWIDPIWECICCIAGQCGLWSYMLLELLPGIFATPTGGDYYPALCYITNPAAYVLGLIVSITGSMFVGMLATRLISIIQKSNHLYA